MRNQCEGRLSSMMGRCEKAGNIIRDGKHYCWMHDPTRLDIQRGAKAKAERERKTRIEAEYEARAKRRKLLRDSGVEYLTDEELQRIIEHHGMKGIFEQLGNYWHLLEKVNHGCLGVTCSICDKKD